MAVLAAYAWKSNAELVAACARLGYLKPHWRVLDPTFGKDTFWKCWYPNQVSSGKVRWQTRIFADRAEAHGFRLVDQLHILGGRPQPEGRRQVHARRNFSTMLVLHREA